MQVYFGDIGADSSVIHDYFARNSAVCPDNVNPAEYMLDAIGAGLTPWVRDRDWVDIWRDSPEFQETLDEIEYIKSEAPDSRMGRPRHLLQDSPLRFRIS